MSGINKKKRILSAFLEAVVVAIFGAVSVLPLSGLYIAYPLYQVLIAVLSALVLSMYLHLLLHELGHMIFGHLSGYKLILFRISSFALVRSENQKLIRRVSSLGASGQCLMTPPECEDYSCPYILYNFGGSLMNLLLGLTCIPVYFFWSSLPGAVIYVFGVVGVFTFLTNWIPLKIGGIPNDGYNNLACGRSREARRAFCLTLRINGQLYEGVRLRDMDSSWFEISENAGEDPLTACHLCLCASRHMDEGDMESARRLFEKAVNSPAIDEVNRKEAACELLYLASLEGRQQAEELYTKELEKYLGTANQSATAKRCAFAWALVSEADKARLDLLKESWRECVNKYAVGATAPMEEVLIDSLEKRYSGSV